MFHDWVDVTRLMLLYSLRATPGVLLPAKVYCMYLNKEGGFSFSPIHQIQYDSCICHQCSPIVQFVLGIIFFGNRDTIKVLIMCEAVSVESLSAK